MKQLTTSSENINLTLLTTELLGFVGVNVVFIINDILTIHVVDDFNNEETVMTAIKIHKDEPSNSDIAQSRLTKIIEIVGESDMATQNGFSSNALGAPHIYSSEPMDQINLMGAVIVGIDMLFACRSSTEEQSTFKPHTAGQLKQVLVDGAIFKQGVLSLLEIKKHQIAIAPNKETIDSVKW